MTAPRRDGQDTPFGRWLRGHPGLDSIQERLSCNDVDYWIHRYRAHTDKVGDRAIDQIMCVEVKTFMADQPYHQRDTLSMVDHLLRLACARKDGRRRHVRMGHRPGETRIIRCFGVHLLQLSADDPVRSQSILWDGHYLTEEMLVEVLRFDRDPDRPMHYLETRRHHTSTRVRNLTLAFPQAR